MMVIYRSSKIFLVGMFGSNTSYLYVHNAEPKLSHNDCFAVSVYYLKSDPLGEADSGRRGGGGSHTFELFKFT